MLIRGKKDASRERDQKEEKFGKWAKSAQGAEPSGLEE